MRIARPGPSASLSWRRCRGRHQIVKVGSKSGDLQVDMHFGDFAKLTENEVTGRGRHQGLSTDGVAGIILPLVELCGSIHRPAARRRCYRSKAYSVRGLSANLSPETMYKAPG